MSTIEVHEDSVQDLYLPVQNVHPTTGNIALSALAVAVAMPAVGASPSSWTDVTWASGTLREGTDRFYVAVAPIAGMSLSAGTTYQPWVRVGGVGGSIIKIPGLVKAINS